MYKGCSCFLCNVHGSNNPAWFPLGALGDEKKRRFWHFLFFFTLKWVKQKERHTCTRVHLRDDKKYIHQNCFSCRGLHVQTDHSCWEDIPFLLLFVFLPWMVWRKVGWASSMLGVTLSQLSFFVEIWLHQITVTIISVTPSVGKHMMQSDVKVTEIFYFSHDRKKDVKQSHKMCLLGCQTHGSATWCVSDVAWSRWNRKPLTEAFGISSIWLDCCPNPLSLVRTAYFILKPWGSPVTPQHICVSKFPNSSLLPAILLTQTASYVMVLKGLGPHVVHLLLWLHRKIKHFIWMRLWIHDRFGHVKDMSTVAMGVSGWTANM